MKKYKQETVSVFNAVMLENWNLYLSQYTDNVAVP